MVHENRKGVQAELRQIPMTLGMHDARIAVNRQIVAAAIDDQGLLQFRERHHA